MDAIITQNKIENQASNYYYLLLSFFERCKIRNALRRAI